MLCFVGSQVPSMVLRLSLNSWSYRHWELPREAEHPRVPGEGRVSEL